MDCILIANGSLENYQCHKRGTLIKLDLEKAYDYYIMSHKGFGSKWRS